MSIDSQEICFNVFECPVSKPEMDVERKNSWRYLGIGEKNGLLVWDDHSIVASVVILMSLNFGALDNVFNVDKMYMLMTFLLWLAEIS